MTPNLFDFATKELSQDAVICWLIAWADADATEGPVDVGLRQCGRAFVDALFAKWQDWPVELGDRIRTEVKRQQNRIDVLARVDGRHVLLIEDKTDTSAHDDQLDRYCEAVIKGETAFGDVANADLFPIYVKTGNHSLRDRQHAKGKHYRVFDRTDFLRVLDTYCGTNPILLDFRRHLQRWERQTDSFRAWTEEDISSRKKDDEETRLGWEGFYRCVEENCLIDFADDWGSLTTQVGSYWVLWLRPAKTSSNSAFEIWIERERLSIRLWGAKTKYSVTGMNREKEHWAKAFIESGGGWLTKPSRFAATKTKPMCVAEWQDWLAFGDDGRLDVDETVRNLKWAREVLLSTITGTG